MVDEPSLRDDEEVLYSTEAYLGENLMREGEVTCTSKRLIFVSKQDRQTNIFTDDISVLEYTPPGRSWTTLIGAGVLFVLAVLFGVFGTTMVTVIPTLVTTGISITVGVFALAIVVANAQDHSDDLALQTQNDSFSLRSEGNSLEPVQTALIEFCD